MKNTAQLVSIINENEIESALAQYKDLDEQIKNLEAKKSLLKESMVKSYFAKNDSYFNDNGLCLATYKPQVRNIFNTTKFKTEHQDLYDAYTEAQEIYMFLVKK